MLFFVTVETRGDVLMVEMFTHSERTQPCFIFIYSIYIFKLSLVLEILFCVLLDILNYFIIIIIIFNYSFSFVLFSF